MSGKKVRVLIAEDHGTMREGMRLIIGREPDMECVGEAADGREALRLARELRPDVVLMDISMPVVDGFEAARRIREDSRETCVLFLTGSNSPADFAEAQAAGGSGYVTKDRIATDLLEAIYAAAPPCG